MAKESKQVEMKEVKYNEEKRIVLWKNDRMTEDNNQPIVRGQITISGKKYYISLWSAKDKNNKTYWQGKARVADEATNASDESLPE